MSAPTKDEAGAMVMAAVPALLRELAGRRSPPPELVPDLVGDAVVITYAAIMRGKLVPPKCPRERASVLHTYLRRVVRNRYGHVLESGDIFHRCARVEMPRASAAYTIDSAVDAAVVFRAQAITERAFLRVVLDTGNITAAGRATGLNRGAARGALRRARKALLAA